MASPALHVDAVVLCSHGGTAEPDTSSTRVQVNGKPVVTLADFYTISGCSLSGSGSPPCATGNWITGAARVTVDGSPVASMEGTSTCVPTGSPMVSLFAQPRVLVT